MASRIVIICGPTASGKSARAIDIAQSGGGVIINADAMQVYRELSVLTARPTKAQERAVPHRLYGVMPAGEACSAAKWLHMARTVIDEVAGSGNLPVVTGGTGLYIKALMEGLSAIPDVPAKIQAQAALLWQEQGARALLERDAEMSARLKDGDKQRHIRALGVVLATGKSLAFWQSQPREKPYPDAAFEVEVMHVPRAELYRRCDARFHSMLEAGALEEVKALHALGLSPHLPAMNAVGVPELIGHLDGKWDLNEATKRACQATRNYAKRQMTWFRHQL